MSEVAYKIDRKIPVPGTRKVSRTARIRNTLGKLRVGESFLIPNKDLQKVSLPKYVIPYKEARDADIRIKSRIDRKGVRIWRVK